MRSSEDWLAHKIPQGKVASLGRIFLRRIRRFRRRRRCGIANRSCCCRGCRDCREPTAQRVGELWMLGLRPGRSALQGRWQLPWHCPCHRPMTRCSLRSSCRRAAARMFSFDSLQRVPRLPGCPLESRRQSFLGFHDLGWSDIFQGIHVALLVGNIHGNLPGVRNPIVLAGQVFQRTGQDGKVCRLSHLQPTPPHVDDNPSICQEARRTNAIVIEVNKRCGVLGFLEDLVQLRATINFYNRDRLYPAFTLPAHRYLPHC